MFMNDSAMNTGARQQHQQGNRDLEQLKRNYKSALSELTFNSKPIITNLTIMAQDNQAAASYIVREIENQLRNNAAGQKLPVLYLIDSICKNVGGIYISYFSRNMVNVFLDAYTLTDPTVRKSFERLLQTWKNGMPGGLPVFPRHVIEPIERSIVYIREKTPASKYPHPPYNATSSGPKGSPMSNSIHVNPNFVPKDQRANPSNSNSSRDPRHRSPQMAESSMSPNPTSTDTILSQLQSLLPSTPNQTIHSDPVMQIISQIKAILPTLPPAQASSIEQYLAQIAPSSTSTVAPVNNHVVAAAAGPAFTSALPTLQNSPLSHSTPSPTISTSNIINTSTPPPSLNNTSSVATTTGTMSTSLRPVTPATSAASLISNVDTADLLKSLTSMGYLSPNSTPSTLPSSSVSPPSFTHTNATNQTTPITLDVFGPFLLDSKDLQIPRPGAAELLYSAEPLQCKQCGFRYPKTEKGQAKMDAHLDSHFRQNRKMKERTKRGLSRSWFVTVDQWINGEGGELTHQQAPTFLHDGMGHAQKLTEKSSQVNNEDSIDPDSYTVVKPDDDSRKPCAICGEPFVDFWNDDEEEWMYKNAVMSNNKLYHATCHLDTIKSGTLAETDVDMQDVNNQILKRKLETNDEQMTKQARTQ
ncbi:hypothetical protein EDC96DRAFT_346839 [Choanephora cucurbitarum]|nr:hypothetical protein EDC96DRAFT_346839 [Choanephora cucurbitarum]